MLFGAGVVVVTGSKGKGGGSHGLGVAPGASRGSHKGMGSPRRKQPDLEDPSSGPSRAWPPHRQAVWTLRSRRAWVHLEKTLASPHLQRHACRPFDAAGCAHYIAPRGCSHTRIVSADV